MAYFIGKIHEPPTPSSLIRAKRPIIRPPATVCTQRFKSREAARIALLHRWPDGSGVVIEAGSRKEAQDTLAGRVVPGPLGRLLLMLHLRSTPRIHFVGSSEADSSWDGGLFGSGSREPRRPSPGGLSASVALRPPNDAPARR